MNNMDNWINSHLIRIDQPSLLHLSQAFIQPLLIFKTYTSTLYFRPAVYSISFTRASLFLPGHYRPRQERAHHAYKHTWCRAFPPGKSYRQFLYLPLLHFLHSLRPSSPQARALITRARILQPCPRRIRLSWRAVYVYIYACWCTWIVTYELAAQRRRIERCVWRRERVRDNGSRGWKVGAVRANWWGRMRGEKNRLISNRAIIDRAPESELDYSGPDVIARFGRGGFRTRGICMKGVSRNHFSIERYQLFECPAFSCSNEILHFQPRSYTAIKRTTIYHSALYCSRN